MLHISAFECTGVKTSSAFIILAECRVVCRLIRFGDCKALNWTTQSTLSTYFIYFPDLLCGLSGSVPCSWCFAEVLVSGVVKLR